LLAARLLVAAVVGSLYVEYGADFDISKSGTQTLFYLI
jgi:hypothetical protein